MTKRKTLHLTLLTMVIIAFFHLGPVSLYGEGDNAALLDINGITGEAFSSRPPVSEAIRFYQARITNTSQDYLIYSILGQLHILHARETGDVTSYQRAEASLRKALEMLPAFTPAESALASVLYAQHDFDGALRLAGQVYERDPENLHALLIIGDAHLSMGEYQLAEEAYQDLLKFGTATPLLARIARLNELRGDTETALQLMQRAAAESVELGISRESIAWYFLRLGGLYFNSGRVDEAADHYEAALRVFENYHLALAGLGKARAAQGRYHEAINLYENAAAVMPQPGTLAALGDLYAKTGDAANAQLRYDMVEFIARLAAINKQVYNRELARFYADHDLNLEEALILATRELDVRRDIYGYDTLAWVLYKNGLLDEAADAIAEAMKLGTQDSDLYFHAGMIHFRLGDKELARIYLEHALELNPHFSLLYEDEARQTLSLLLQEAELPNTIGVAKR